MPTLLIFHEVDDVEHWLSSPKREEVFGPLGITVRTFIDPAKSHRVGLIAEVPDMDTFQRIMESRGGSRSDEIRRRPSGNNSDARRALVVRPGPGWQ